MINTNFTDKNNVILCISSDSIYVAVQNNLEKSIQFYENNFEKGFNLIKNNDITLNDNNNEFKSCFQEETCIFYAVSSSFIVVKDLKNKTDLCVINDNKGTYIKNAQIIDVAVNNNQTIPLYAFISYTNEKKMFFYAFTTSEKDNINFTSEIDLNFFTTTPKYKIKLSNNDDNVCAVYSEKDLLILSLKDKSINKNIVSKGITDVFFDKDYHLRYIIFNDNERNYSYKSISTLASNNFVTEIEIELFSSSGTKTKIGAEHEYIFSSNGSSLLIYIPSSNRLMHYYSEDMKKYKQIKVYTLDDLILLRTIKASFIYSNRCFLLMSENTFSTFSFSTAVNVS